MPIRPINTEFNLTPKNTLIYVSILVSNHKKTNFENCEFYSKLTNIKSFVKQQNIIFSNKSNRKKKTDINFANKNIETPLEKFNYIFSTEKLYKYNSQGKPIRELKKEIFCFNNKKFFEIIDYYLFEIIDKTENKVELVKIAENEHLGKYILQLFSLFIWDYYRNELRHIESLKKEVVVRKEINDINPKYQLKDLMHNFFYSLGHVLNKIYVGYMNRDLVGKYSKVLELISEKDYKTISKIFNKYYLYYELQYKKQLLAIENESISRKNIILKEPKLSNYLHESNNKQ